MANDAQNFAAQQHQTKVMQTIPPPPLQTTGGANEQLVGGENPATFAETPVTDHSRGDGGSMSPAGGAPTGPTVAEAGKAAKEAALAPYFAALGTPNQNAQEPDENMVAASIDRLPVVGIRKARTRRVLIV